MNRCPSCNGNKQIRKLGNILGDCDACKGKGVVDDDTLKLFATPPALPVGAGDSVASATVAHYIKQEVDANKARIKNANVAYMNKPIDLDPKRKNDASSYLQKPLINIPEGIKQAPDHRIAPKPLPEHELMKMRSEIVERDDTLMAAQKILDEPIESIESEAVAESEIESKPKTTKAKGIATNGKKERKAARS